VHVEPPGGDPMRPTAPAWHDAVNAGKESVVCDLKTEDGLALANGLCARADAVLDGFRPGVLDRLGVVVPETAVLCSVTGFGDGNRHELRAGTTSTTSAGRACSPTPRRRCRRRRSPTWPPAASRPRWSVAAPARARARRPRRHVVVSMTHGSHRLVAHRLEGLPERC
jgi:crotonobetainyl-CoA:carnitine CoA-transferase CaiB-like acyl-CoA transferase